MTIGCNIWMICLKLNWFFFGLSNMLQFSEFVWALSFSLWDVFNNFLLIDSTDRSKIISYQKRFFNALSLYPLSFFANTPFKNKWFAFGTHYYISIFTTNIPPLPLNTFSVAPVWILQELYGIPDIFLYKSRSF